VISDSFVHKLNTQRWRDPHGRSTWCDLRAAGSAGGIRWPSAHPFKRKPTQKAREAQGARKPLAAARTDELMGYLRQNGKTLTADDCLTKPAGILFKREIGIGAGASLFQKLLNIRDAGEGDFTAGERLAL
jgi:hypothetical protein